MRIVKFALVGASGIIVNEGLLWLLTEVAGLYYLLSSAFAIEASIITNFLLNNAWTFRDRAGNTGLKRRGLKFNLVSIGGLAINMAVLFLLVNYLSIYYLYANIAGILAGFLWNYSVNLRWTFKAGTA